MLRHRDLWVALWRPCSENEKPRQTQRRWVTNELSGGNSRSTYSPWRNCCGGIGRYLVTANRRHSSDIRGRGGRCAQGGRREVLWRSCDAVYQNLLPGLSLQQETDG